MPSNCGPSNCVGNSCLIKRRTKKSRKSRNTKARSRRLRGGAPTVFTVILFSADPVAEETKEGLLNLLENLYGAIEMTEGVDEFTLEDFQAGTGINRCDIDDGENAISYKINVAPAILGNKKLRTDKRLTVLEGQIGTALLNSGLDVSLIGLPHGLRPNVNSKNIAPNMYYIGLSTPICTDFDQESFNSYMKY